MAVKRVGGFIAKSGEIKDALRHCGMSLYQRGGSRITQKEPTGIGFDGHVASPLIRFKQNAKLAVIEFACATHQLVFDLCRVSLSSSALITVSLARFGVRHLTRFRQKR